jgi:hypothetical protein
MTVKDLPFTNTRKLTDVLNKIQFFKEITVSVSWSVIQSVNH